MRRNQKGFTLVEMITVMAIMAITITISLVSYSLVVGQNLKGCTSDVKGYLAKARVESLSRTDVKLTLSSTKYGVYANLSLKDGATWSGSDEKIGRPAIEIKYKTTKSATDLYAISDTNKLVLTFDRSTGAFKPLPPTIEGADGPGSYYCTEIQLRQGDRAMKITLYPKTGKYKAESM